MSALASGARRLPAHHITRRIGVNAEIVYYRANRRYCMNSALTPVTPKLEVVPKTSGPINAIMLDQTHGTMWGGSSDHGEDYGIGW